MQRFHAAAHDLGESRVGRNFAHRHAAAAEQLRRAAGGEYIDVAFCQRARKLHETGFIGYGKKRAANGQQHLPDSSWAAPNYSADRTVARAALAHNPVWSLAGPPVR